LLVITDHLGYLSPTSANSSAISSYISAPPPPSAITPDTLGYLLLSLPAISGHLWHPASLVILTMFTHLYIFNLFLQHLSIHLSPFYEIFSYLRSSPTIFEYPPLPPGYFHHPSVVFN
jgi:hypothetical protein